MKRWKECGPVSLRLPLDAVGPEGARRRRKARKRLHSVLPVPLRQVRVRAVGRVRAIHWMCWHEPRRRYGWLVPLPVHGARACMLARRGPCVSRSGHISGMRWLLLLHVRRCGILVAQGCILGCTSFGPRPLSLVIPIPSSSLSGLSLRLRLRRALCDGCRRRSMPQIVFTRLTRLQCLHTGWRVKNDPVPRDIPPGSLIHHNHIAARARLLAT